MQPDTKFLLVGCGKMGGAILRRVAESVTACIVDPVPPAPHLKALPHTLWFQDAKELPPAFIPDIVLLAVKPNALAAALPAYTRLKESVFLSIAAGVPLVKLADALGTDKAIVRAMPNLPASIGEGMTVAVAGKNVGPTQRSLCSRFLEAVGALLWVEDENLLDAVTALSGSGPAYIFALCEAMTKAGIALGLPSSMAAQLARHTVMGSGALLAQSSESAEALRVAVTSPGGTTEAALKELWPELSDLMIKAMKAAAVRAKDLARLA